MKRFPLSLMAAGIVLASGSVPLFTHAAQIYLDPATGKYPPGVTFGVDVRVDTPHGQCLNVFEVDLSYPKDILQAVAATDGNSILSVWVKEPTIYQDYGLVSLVGGLPGGYCGRVTGDPTLSNKLATIYFRFPTSTAPAASSSVPQTARLSFLPGTRAVLNDGSGTIAPITLSGASYATILKGQYASVDTWQTALQNDATPPEPFTVSAYRDPSLFSNQWFAVFSTVDKQTGIDHYEVAEVPPSSLKQPQSQWNWFRAVSPYLIKDQTLNDTIAVRAIDAAGNVRVAEYTATSTQQKAPQQAVSTWQYLAIIGVVGFVILQFFLHLL